MSNNFDKFVKRIEETEHSEAPEQYKKNSIIDSGVTEEGEINYLMKLRKGCLNKMELTLDNIDGSDTVVPLRLLSTAEMIQIEDDIAGRKFSNDWTREKTRLAKTLSVASQPYCSPAKNKVDPVVSEAGFLYLPVHLLIWLGQKYEEFKNKYAPRPEELTEDDIKHIISTLDNLDYNGVKQGVSAEEIRRKKLDLLTLLDSTTMLETLIIMQEQLKTNKQQMAQLLTP